MTVIDPARIEANWRAIQIELDAPRPALTERVLRRVGVPANISRIMAATPALRRSWFAALGLVMFLALTVADTTRPLDSYFPVLFLAPLVPVLGVSMAYGPVADPAHEIGLATPLRGLKLVIIRAATVLVFAIFGLGLVSLLSPAPAGVAFAWLLPSLALSASTLALMTRFTPRQSALAVGAAWSFAAIAATGAADGDRLALFAAAGQLTALVVLAIAGAVLQLRHTKFDLLDAKS